MTINYNDDPSYANAKLQGSLVRRGTTPILVSEVGEDGTVYYHTAGTSIEGHCPLSELDLEPVPLGYVNHPTGCSFTTRIPARHWRQGLRDGLINSVGRTARRVATHSVNLVSTILNQYPSMISCYESIINGEATEKAFSRDFALGTARGASLALFYQGWNVGKMSFREGGYTMTLKEEYEYLQEVYQEQLNA